MYIIIHTDLHKLKSNRVVKDNHFLTFVHSFAVNKEYDYLGEVRFKGVSSSG